ALLRGVPRPPDLLCPRMAGRAPPFAPRRLEQTTGDRIYYTGIELFPGENSGFRPLPPNVIDVNALPQDRSVVFEFTPSDDDRRYLGVARALEQRGGRRG